MFSLLTHAKVFDDRWLESQTDGSANEQEDAASSLHGFAAISRRHTSYKPMIAAVNGSAYGGGVEILLNCDLVVASDDAVFALPEVKRGVLASQGGACLLCVCCCVSVLLGCFISFQKNLRFRFPCSNFGSGSSLRGFFLENETTPRGAPQSSC